MKDKNKDIDSQPADSLVKDSSNFMPKPLREKAKKELIRQKREEDQLWKEVKKKNNKEDYEEYLEKYPDGEYLIQAQSEIYYRFINMGDLTEGECRTYLDRYPTERHAEKIRDRLNTFILAEQKKKTAGITIIGLIFFGLFLYAVINAPTSPPAPTKQDSPEEMLIEAKMEPPALISTINADDLSEEEDIEFEPDLFSTYFLRGLAYNEKGQHDMAILEFTKAIELDQGDPSAYFNRGFAYNEASQYDKAISDYNKAIKLDPNDPAAYNNRAIAYRKTGQHDRAIPDYTKAIELDPAESSAYFNRGFAYSKTGRYDMAIPDYTQAIELDPDNSLTYHNRGFAYSETGRYDMAIPDLSKAIELEPDDPLAYHNRGYAYVETGEYDMAILDYNKLIELDPDDSSVYYARGMVYNLMGNRELANSDLRQARDLGNTEAGNELDMMQ